MKDTRVKQRHSKKIVRLNWKGPFRWPKTSSKSFLKCPEAKLHGLYAWGIMIGKNQYLICGFGITRKTFASRIGYHNRSYRNGRYAIYNLQLIKNEIRKDIWPGMYWNKEAWRKLRSVYEKKRSGIARHAERLLEQFHIFVAPVPGVPRVLERIESAMYRMLRDDSSGAGIIIDEGWAVSYKTDRELPIVVKLSSKPQFKGLPKMFEA